MTTGPSTAKSMHPAIGKQGYLHSTADYPMTFRVEILDVKSAYGNERYLIRPVAGTGEKWVNEDRVTDLFDAELRAPHEGEECNAMFCVAAPHLDEQHTDATGHSWRAPVPESEVIAHVYGTAAE